MVRFRNIVAIAAAARAARMRRRSERRERSTIRFSFVPQRAYQGLPAAVSVLVKPAGVNCSLAVRYVDGSLQAGLGAVRASAGTCGVDVEPRPGRTGGARPRVGRVRPGGQLSRACSPSSAAPSRTRSCRSSPRGSRSGPTATAPGSSVSYGVVLANPSASRTPRT